MRHSSPKVLFALVTGVVLGSTVMGRLNVVSAPAATAAQADSDPVTDEELDAELAQLRARTAMIAVDYHATNLWFAGKAENWPLADYYWEQTLNHVRLSAASKPAREGVGGNQRDMEGIVDAIQKAPRMQVGAAIDAKDLRQFLVSYRGLLEGCYACHKAAGMPFLRPKIPAPPASSIISIDTRATWPQ